MQQFPNSSPSFHAPGALQSLYSNQQQEFELATALFYTLQCLQITPRKSLLFVITPKAWRDLAPREVSNLIAYNSPPFSFCSIPTVSPIVGTHLIALGVMFSDWPSSL